MASLDLEPSEPYILAPRASTPELDSTDGLLSAVDELTDRAQDDELLLAHETASVSEEEATGFEIIAEGHPEAPLEDEAAIDPLDELSESEADSKEPKRSGEVYGLEWKDWGENGAAVSLFRGSFFFILRY